MMIDDDYFDFLLQGAGSDKFAIDIPSLGYVTVRNTLDFESLNSAGNTNYVLSIRAMVCVHRII